MIFAGIAAFMLSAVVGLILVMSTPLKMLLPGYYHPSQRAAAEAALLRVDSLRMASERRQQYVDNVLRIFNPATEPTDSVMAAGRLNELTPDSLLGPSPLETRFNAAMSSRERFNISVAAPLAAEDIIFYPPMKPGVLTAESRESYRAAIAAPPGTPVMAVADGTIISVEDAPGPSGRAVVVQHTGGFVTRYSGLGTLLVGNGDTVTGGQAIAVSRQQRKSDSGLVTLQMWHNGTPILPGNYITGLSEDRTH